MTLAIFILQFAPLKGQPQAYPSTSTFWVCGGSGIPAQDTTMIREGLLVTRGEVLQWEASHCDWSAFGGTPYRIYRPTMPILSYMYTGAIGLNGFFDFEVPFREQTYTLNHNWESFFLHYSQDTWLNFENTGMPNALYEDSAVWAGIPAGVGFTNNLHDTTGVVLQDSGPWYNHNDIFQGCSGGGYFYIVNPEKFGEFTISLRGPGSGGHITIQYASAVDMNNDFKVTNWKTLTLTSDGTNNFDHTGRVSWVPPSDWAWGKNPAPKFADRENYGHWLRIMGTEYTRRPLLSSLTTRAWMILDSTAGGQLKNPGWDPANDRNGDGYVDDTEYAHLVDVHATARFPYEGRLAFNTPGFGNKWNPCVTNTANAQYQADVATYYKNYWPAAGWNGGYNDNFFLNLNKWFFPVQTGGQLINEGLITGRVQDPQTNLAFSNNFAATLKTVKQVTGTNWMGANTYFINPYDYYAYCVPYPTLGKDMLTSGAFSYFLLEGTIFDSWSMIDAESFLGKYSGMGCIWHVPALAKAGIKTGIMTRIGTHLLPTPPFALKDSTLWHRSQESLLAEYYLYNIPGYTSFQDILGSNINFPLLTTNETYYKPGVPASYAYQPHSLLSVDIGIPTGTIPQGFGYTPMQYIARVNATNDYNNTVIGTTTDNALLDTAYSFSEIPVIPTATYYLKTFASAPFTWIAYDNHEHAFPAEVVLARQYTKGMVVFRTTFASPLNDQYTRYASDTNVITVTLPGSYQIVDFNGRLSAPVTQITLHGFEGVVLKSQTADRLASIVETSPSANVLVYPNPFSKQTTVVLNIEANSDVQIILYNSLGQEVSTVENKYLSAGNYNYQVNVKDKGFYFLRSFINGVPSIQKLMEVE